MRQPAGKVFVLDGKFAWSYTPGDAQVQRLPAKQVDDLRSPLRFLLGHTQLQKELDGIVGDAGWGRIPDCGGAEGDGAAGEAACAGGYGGGADHEDACSKRWTGRRQSSSSIGSEENVPLAETEFHFVAPAGTTVVEGTPPV